MVNVILKKVFKYTNDGYTIKVVPVGEAEIPDDQLEAAKQMGCIEKVIFNKSEDAKKSTKKDTKKGNIPSNTDENNKIQGIPKENQESYIPKEN